MKELVVISGKGGTGKTSFVASFAALAALDGRVVLADCDVDAADLHLLVEPSVRQREEFRCGNVATIRQEDCYLCGSCLALCRFDAVREIESPGDESTFVVDPTACEGCGVCVDRCPAGAIDFPERVSGEQYVSETRFGPMAHARLVPGGENSGKLVTRVRDTARKLAEERGADLILVDGPPGVGCPVIASITGATLVLVVTEPTLSGIHDLRRVLELTRHFDIPTAVCVNKWDINPELTDKIEAETLAARGVTVGRVRYDRAVTAAQVARKTLVELPGAPPAAGDLEAVWKNLKRCSGGPLGRGGILPSPLSSCRVSPNPLEP